MSLQNKQDSDDEFSDFSEDDEQPVKQSAPQSGFGKKAATVLIPAFNEEDKENSDSESGVEESVSEGYSESSSDFDDSSPQCKIRSRRSGSIIKFSPEEFTPPIPSGPALTTGHNEVLVPIPSNKTYTKKSLDLKGEQNQPHENLE